MIEQIKLIPTDKGLAVKLILEDKQYKPKRIIGMIKNRVLCTYRNPNNMHFKKLNAIGINYRLLSNGASHFDIIRVQYGLTILETTREYFLYNGNFLHFKSNNLDKQIFMKISDFGMYKAQTWKKKKQIITFKQNTQLELFT